jgi:hypothetical protein
MDQWGAINTSFGDMQIMQFYGINGEWGKGLHGLLEIMQGLTWKADDEMDTNKDSGLMEPVNSFLS